MAWCEANRVDFLFGLARNERLEEAIKAELITATLQSIRTGKPARCFRDFTWSTLDSWSRERRVVGKAEVTGGEANPRFVVTSLKSTEVGGRYLYEKVYCARGEMENRIKVCNSTCSLTALRPRRCAPTNSDCGSPRWPMCCSVLCAASGWHTRNLPRRPAEPFG